MTNATLPLNTPTLKKDHSEILFWLREKLEKLKHGLLEKVNEDFLL